MHGRFHDAVLTPNSIFDREANLQLFQAQGFIVLENKENLATEEYIEFFRTEYGLKDYFHSEFNKTYHRQNLKNNVALIGQIDAGIHPSFNSCNGQDFHVDGTFETIGTIKTSLLYCIEDADIGGENILFDAVGAFLFLKEHYPHCALALMDDRALVRRSTTGSDDVMIGPAFQYEQGKLITRFTLDISARWEEAFPHVSHLREAVDIMRGLAEEGSQYFLKVRLTPQQMFVFENDTLAHGRLPYQQIQKRRLMARALFRTRLTPAVHAQKPAENGTNLAV